MAAVALPAPSPGDASYGVLRVRIAPGLRLAGPAGLSGQPTIFASRVGGLAIRAQSRGWRALRASTRVYVVVSMVPGGSRSLRDVGFFILRRKTGAGAAGANLTFTIANARAQVGSFWVRGINARGYAAAFAVRDILSTAIGNWGRYVRSLQLAHAIAAAAHPLILGGASAASAGAARGRVPGPWTGGQHPDSLVVAMYRLIFGALRDPTSFAALKKDPVVADFIATELRNQSLAARWRTVVAQVPLKVPDQYAAASQEERRFAHVVAPTITHARVAIDDGQNSSVEGGIDGGLFSRPMTLNITVSGGGSVAEVGGGRGAISCPVVCSEQFQNSGLQLIELQATPAAGMAFKGWVGGSCLYSSLSINECELFMTSDLKLTAVFGPPMPDQLSVSTVSEESGQMGTVTSNPPGINCGSSCSASFASGTSVTLTATPAYASYFDRWTGCDTVSGNSCAVTVNRVRSVLAYFGYP
jgi:Divergent InlB B-repeat domain